MCAWASTLALALVLACGGSGRGESPKLVQGPEGPALPVVIWFDEFNEVLEGTGRQYHFLQGIPLDLRGKVGHMRCVGEAYQRILPPDADPPQRCDGILGDAILRCSDGRNIRLDWWSEGGCGSGYGRGLDEQGHTFHMAFGGSWERAKMIATEALAEGRNKPPLPSLEQAAEATPGTSSATGTAFFVGWEGYLLTNHHVINRARRIAVKLDDGDVIDAELVAEDPQNDLALLKVEAIRAPLPVREDPGLTKGEEVFTLGYPLIALQGQEQKATFGHVNALSGFQDDERFAQIDVPIQPGNSGGPLINLRGEVVGVVTSMLHPKATLEAVGVVPQNVNYALKSDLAHDLLSKQIATGTSLTLEELPEEGVARRDLSELVSDVEGSVVLVLVN